MAEAISQGGLVLLTQQWRVYLNTCTLRLFQNNHTPAATDTVAQYTEATFTGYAAVGLNSWGNAYLNAANIGEIDETSRTFTQTGVAQTCLVFGYYITDPNNNLVYAESNDNGAFNMNASGLVYIVQARMIFNNAP